MTPLQTLVLTRMAELGLSFRTAAARSGGNVSHSTLNNIVLGKHGGQFDDETLHGIALALDLPQSRVREAVGATRDAPTEFRLPRKANKLSPAERRAVLTLVDALLEHHSE